MQLAEIPRHQEALAVLAGAAVAVAILGASRFESSRRRWGTVLAIAFATFGVCVVGLVVAESSALLIAAGALTAGWMGLVVYALADTKKAASAEPSESGAKGRVGLTLAALVCLAIVAGVLGALIFDGGGTAATTISVFVSQYHVKGTCGDHSCVLNECKKPRPCGLGRVQRADEGAALDIACQRLGRVAHANDGSSSRIWDRLESSGLYVSDLFVSGTAEHGFLDRLPRCGSV